MLNIIHATTFFKSGEIICAACIAPESDYSYFNITVTLDDTCKIYHHKNVYGYQGNTSSGIPAIEVTHFYYPRPAA